MPGFDVTALANWTGGHWLGECSPEAVSGFAFDARQLVAGECFVAMSGGARDGHDFAPQAVEKGASALIVERALDLSVPQLVVPNSLQAMAAIGYAVRSAFDGKVIGVTGSCGKTSTKEMLRAILGSDQTHATAGNWNNLIGVPMTLFGLDAAQQDYAVIEAGINQPGEMPKLGTMIEPDLTVVTMIGSAHLELLETTDNIAWEKSALMEAGRSGSHLITTHSVMTYPAFQRFSDRATVLVPEGARLDNPSALEVYYSLEPTESGGMRLKLGDESFQISSSSRGICENAALAILAAWDLSIPTEQIRERIEQWHPDGNRGRIAQAGAQTFYVDCYNANPSSMRDAFPAFTAAMPEELPRCYVLGVMNELGDAAVDLHESTAAGLELREEDFACFVGPGYLRAAYVRGLLSTEAEPDQIHAVESCEELKSFIADFEGAIFLKGSRAYALENLLPAGL